MNIWAKMMTALRGGVNEAGEAFVDSQALQILDREVLEASENLKQSRNALAEMMARHKVVDEKCVNIKQKIEQHEEYAVKALDKGDETLALEIAEKVASLENQLQEEKDSSNEYAVNVSGLRTAIKQTERNLKRLKQQVDTVKATENVQRAQAAVAQRNSGSQAKMRTAMDSLERIKERQMLKDAEMAAANEVAADHADDALQAKLEQAGITSSGHSAADVLERIKHKRPSNKK
jgi:phage shock protein A